MPSIKPKDFVKSSLADSTAGDVIRHLHSEESSRRRDSGEEDQRDVAISFRVAPEGLLSSINTISLLTGMNKAVITKCLSRHAMSWYQSLTQLPELERLYQPTYVLTDGHDDLSRLLSRPGYEFFKPASGLIKTSVRTVSFVLGYLDGVSGYSGVAVSQLLLSGLCWSISTNKEGWVTQSTQKHLAPEWKRLIRHLKERVLLFQYIDAVIALRKSE